MAYLLKSHWLSICALVLLSYLPLHAAAGIQEDFMWAVEKGNVPEVSRLLEKGANPDLANRDGYTPLMIAAKDKNLNMAQVLIAAGAQLDIRNRYGETAIMLASYHGLTELVRLFYIKDAEINHSGWNPLTYAAYGGHLDTLRLLLSGGANINSITDNGSTALMMAVRGNHVDAVSLLLDQGADPAIKNEHGDNALVWAEKYNHSDMVKFLKNHKVAK